MSLSTILPELIQFPNLEAIVPRSLISQECGEGFGITRFLQTSETVDEQL